MILCDDDELMRHRSANNRCMQIFNANFNALRAENINLHDNERERFGRPDGYEWMLKGSLGEMLPLIIICWFQRISSNIVQSNEEFLFLLAIAKLISRQCLLLAPPIRRAEWNAFSKLDFIYVCFLFIDLFTFIFFHARNYCIHTHGVSYWSYFLPAIPAFALNLIIARRRWCGQVEDK